PNQQSLSLTSVAWKPLTWPSLARRLKRCSAIFSLDKINVVRGVQSNERRGSANDLCGHNPANLEKRRGPKLPPGAGCKDVITVKTLALAMEKRLGGTMSEALAEARTVMSYFGFRTEIIDNAIQPEDRKLFYSLHDAGLLQTFWETF